MDGEGTTSQEGGFKGFWKRHKLFVLGGVGLLVAFVVIKYFGGQGQALVATTDSGLLGSTTPTTGSGGLPGATPAPAPVPPTPAPGTHPAENGGVPVTPGAGVLGIVGSGPANPPAFLGPPVHKPPLPLGSGPPAPPDNRLGHRGGGAVAAGLLGSYGAVAGATFGGTVSNYSHAAGTVNSGIASIWQRMFTPTGLPFLPTIGAVIPGIGAHHAASSPRPKAPPRDVLAANIALQHPNGNTPLARGGGGPTPTAPDVHASSRPAYTPPPPAPASVGLAHHQPAPLPPHRIGVQGQHGGQLY